MASNTNAKEIAELVNRLFHEHRRSDGQEYSNQEVAHELGIHPSYMGKVRAGKVPNPGRDTLKQLCLFFQVPSSYFFPELDSLEAPAKRSRIDFRNALRDFGLDEETQFHIESLIQRLRKRSDNSK